MEKTRKREITGISFARAILTLSIVLIHFVGATEKTYAIVDRYFYAPWNSMAVTGFFMISGAVLYYNHDEIPSLKEFYFKRFKSIYPAYYIAYSYFFIQKVFETGDLLTHGQPWCLIFSLLGMDGYLEFKIPNYYLIGEWFVGAIVILYILYPLLLKGIKKAPMLTTALSICMYYVMLKTMFHTVYAMRNIFTCIMSFVLGMLIIRYESFFLKNIWIGVVSLVYLFTSGRLYVLPIDPCTITQLNGYALFFVLYYIGEYAMRSRTVKKPIAIINRIGFPIFLVHHRIVDKMIGYHNPSSSADFTITFIVTLLLSFAGAQVLYLVTNRILKSNAWQKFERTILKKSQY